MHRALFLLRSVTRTEALLAALTGDALLTIFLPVKPAHIGMLILWWAFGLAAPPAVLAIAALFEASSTRATRAFARELGSATSPDAWRVAVYAALARSRGHSRRLLALVVAYGVLQTAFFLRGYWPHPERIDRAMIALVPLTVALCLLLVDAQRTARQHALWRTVVRGSYLDALPSDPAGEGLDDLATLLHDTVGRDLALMSIYANTLSSGVAMDADTLDGALRQLQTSAQTARTGLAALVGGLLGPTRSALDASRDDESELIAMVSRLTTSLAAAGCTLELDVDPPSWAALAAHPAAHEVVGELVTNAVKHAAPGRVSFAVVARHDELVVRVSNPIDATAARLGSSRRGLAVAEERLRATGGALSHAVEDGVFTATATFCSRLGERAQTSSSLTM